MVLNKKFLSKLDQQKNKEVYIRIVAQNWKEQPVEKIEGRATGGSINIDGASAVRRTCSLSLVAEEVNINMFYWGIESKFELFIGVKNTVDKQYDDIIWFNQGIYVITSFNVSQTVNNFTISVSGKDKMCLLNGEIGGSITDPVDFGIQENIIYKKENGQFVYDDNGNKEVETIEYEKIPIKTIIKEMVHTYGKEPYSNIVILDIPDYGAELMRYNGDTDLFFIKNGNIVENMSVRDEIIDGQKLSYWAETGKTFKYGNKKGYTCQRVGPKQEAGYRTTPLTYAGELIAKQGESITSVLDKIKNMLGEYEYFYDLNGKFIFQRKKIYVNTTFNGLKIDSRDQTYLDPTLEEYSYSFDDQVLISSFQNTPNLVNVKNDFSIWGTYKSLSGASIPIHIRYAIDKKPTFYVSPYEDGLVKQYNEDWRYTIYRMANDFYKHGTEDTFTTRIREAHLQAQSEGRITEQDVNFEILTSGRTGYEQYYTDIFSFWEDIGEDNGQLKQDISKDENLSQLRFWFDFLDADESALSRFSVPAIGPRTKVINDSKVTALFYPEVPEAVFAQVGEQIPSDLGYTVINLPSGFAGVFSISGRGKSAEEVLNETLYNFGYSAQSVSVSAIPIYYLNPNTRIKIYDLKSQINGDYLLTKITIPLNYNGMMSLNATKIENRVL